MLPDTVKELLEDAAKRAPDNHVVISIRKLISYWDAKRRGYWIVDQIERELGQYKLKTHPPLNEGWIDSDVELVPVRDSQRASPQILDNSSPRVVEETNRALPQASLKVGILSSANMGVILVKMDDDLETAQTLMMRYDYSQLPVMSGPRDLRGAVSWESIAQARINKADANLRDCTVSTSSQVVRSDDDLLPQVPRIIDSGYVFVQGADGKITGIVTTADLSNQFVSLARPFFILGEIERRIRRIVDDKFSVDDLKSCVNPADPTRTIGSARDMTMGEYVRLLENPIFWSRLGWGLDRKVFIDALEKVRKARNEVMHFSPDPLDGEDLLNLENFVKWIKKLDFGP